MMSSRYFKLALLFLLVSSCAQAQAPSRLEELKHRAEHEKEQKRGPAYVDIARELVENANNAYGDGNQNKAEEAIKESLTYAYQAVASAKERGKKIKETEINLRKLSNRVEEIRHSVALDDQPPLEAAHRKLEQLRTELLDRMFSKDR